MRASLLDYLFENVSRTKDVAYRYRRRLRHSQLTYAQLAQKAFQFARELETKNIGKGDRVLLWAENSPEWVSAFYGALLRGAILVPLDEQSGIDFVQRVCRQTSPALILCGSDVRASVLEFPKINLEDFSRAISRHSTDLYEAKDISRSDTVEIVFSSGTTGEPKGVKLTHENILANVEVLEAEINKYLRWEFLVHPLRILGLLPLSHVFGQVMNIFVPPILRAEVIFQHSLKPAEIVEIIKHERISILATVPRVLENLQRKIERELETNGRTVEVRREPAKSQHWILRWWRFRKIHRMFGLKFLCVISGGATLSAQNEEFWRKLGFAVVQGYGMTETAALVSLNNPFSSKSGSIGQVLPGQEVMIGEGGEILVRGKNISEGYFSGGESKTENGWFHTGDIGGFDEGGRLYFKGRTKNIIVTSAGLKIYPEDLEAALNSQPEIIDSAVVRLRDETGDVPFAALIVRENTDAKSAVEKANRNLAPHQQIRRWLIWPEPDFPRTPTHKIRKAEVAEIIRKSLGESPAENKAPAHSAIADIISLLRREKSVSLDADSTLGADLKLDSLSRTELLSAIEDRYQIDLDESALTETTKIGDLEKMIRLEGAEEKELSQFTFPYWSLRFPVSWLRRAFFFAVVLPVTKILSRARVFGLGNLSNVKAPVVIASNHVTEIDAAIIMSVLPNWFRNKLAIAMDGEMLEGFRHPPVGTNLLARIRLFIQYWLVISLMNVFPLPKKSGFRRSFRFAGDAMDAGYNILIFPEGHLTKDGRLQEFRSGVGLLAKGLEAPVVPLAIRGLYKLKTEGRRFYAPRGALNIFVGEPILYDPKLSEADFTRILEARVSELLDAKSRPEINR
jgi:long-chain acyl-CoA synthetase